MRAVGRRRADRRDRRRPSVDGNVLQVAERPPGSRLRQGADGGEAGGRVGDRAGARQGASARVLEIGGALALPHLVAEHERVGPVARLVSGRAARVEPDLWRPLDHDGVVELDCDVDLGAEAVRGVGGRRGDAGGERRRRQSCKIQRNVVTERGRQGIDAAAQGKSVDCQRWRGSEAASGRQQGAVPAYADQLVVGTPRAYHGVRGAAAAGKVGGNGARAVEIEAGIGVARRAGRLQGAVPVHADQLDGALLVGRDEGVHCSVQLEGCEAAHAAERQGGVLIVGQRVHRLQGAVLVYPDQLDAVVALRGDEGMLFAAQVEHGQAPRAVEHQGAVVDQRPTGLQGAVLVYPDQLHGAAIGSRNEGVQATVQVEHCDFKRAVERQVGIMQECRRLYGVVIVHTEQLHGVFAKRGYDDIHGAVHLKEGHTVDISQSGVFVVAEEPRRREGAVFVHVYKLHASTLQDHRGVRVVFRCGVDADVLWGVDPSNTGVGAADLISADWPRGVPVDQDVRRGGQRAGRARRRQGQAGWEAVRAVEVSRQGARSAVV